MVSLTVNFGVGFVAGVFLSLLILLVFAIVVFRRIRDHINSRDLSTDRIAVVDAIARMIADVLDHPEVADSLSRAVTTGISTWMSSDEAQNALFQAYAKAPMTDAARQIGKEVPGYVKHFGLGVMDTLTFRNVPQVHEPAVAAEHTEDDVATDGKKTKAHRKKE
mmetsp:Transcript_17776/g.39393  ORF Transcript_17776/g.39393 Transcript_17776/m.39393 type:complete len:164 (-) Transcript_17776:86-577(-)